MKMKLPERLFFTTAELAERWNYPESMVLHLIETGQLPKADKYAAIRGKRRSMKFPRFAEDLVGGRKTALDEIWETIHEVIKDDELLVQVDMPDRAAIDREEYDLAIKDFFEKTPDILEIVVLLKDVQQFEEINVSLQFLEEKIGASVTNQNCDDDRVDSKLPGKTPSTWIGKKAAEIAFGVEKKTGKKATCKEVMKELRELAKAGDIDGKLSLKDGFPGVLWYTSKGGHKPWDEMACAVALRRWNESRQQ
jgi:hypothetical protein